MSPRDLAELDARVRRDLALISYPELRWLRPLVGPGGEKVLDVLIVGGGQGGQALSFKLKLERIDNHLVIDRGPAGAEGPWRTFGRMKTLRTWKTVTGPDLGIPSLTYQSWFEAQHGAEAFARLNKIARESWSEYLHWLRRVLALPIEVGTEMLGIEPLDIGPGGALLSVRVKDAAGERRILARHVVLAHGIEASGRWTMPAFVERLPPGMRAHAADAIDFAALRGRRVAVLGAGASAFDNAAAALEVADRLREQVAVARRRSAADSRLEVELGLQIGRRETLTGMLGTA
ncbi:MAG: SidA/IucD/PvdA family monooxygenase [Rhodospirillales bacterium]|nr:SidA/IucD/PvdA family monooxygenase [Rhodospirillales bacterium]